MMSYLRKCFLILAQWPIVATMAFAAGPITAKYFRQDAGIAAPAVGPLPDNFDSPGVLRWRVPLGSGQSTPIVHGGKIFLTTYSNEAKELATLALDERTGGHLWKRVVAVPRIETYHPKTGNAAVATPACDGQRLYVFFGSYGLICYDLDGKQLWERRMGPFQDEYGAGSSPILLDNKIILCQDHDIDSFVMAIDGATGKTIWKAARPDAIRSYSTPTVWTRNGRKELLVAGALELASYDPATGERLWWTHGLARIVIPIPVPAGEMVYMASWAPGGDPWRRLVLDAWADALAKWDKNKDGRLAKDEIDDQEVLNRFARMDLDESGALDKREWERHAAVFQRAQNALLALKPSSKGELRDSDVLWKYQRGIPYVASPLLDQGIVWLVKDGGIATKLDAATGELLQEERLPGPGSYYASPVTGDGKVYFASEQGVVSVLANQKEWKVISSHNFREKIYATPRIEPGRVYIRTDKALYCFRPTKLG